ncbi:hypothetical protein OG21DRAFT_1481652 [Imleria badia]|nr:hypothetical protein OG21DRAFT_1481652 [Imleria badia]
MNPAPGNVYPSDLSMDLTELLYTSSPASISTHPPWPGYPDAVPGHLIPGASFSAYTSPFHLPEESFEIYDTGDNRDLNSVYMGCHQDWTAKRSRDFDINQCVGQEFPPLTSDFCLDPVGEAVLPLSDFPGLPALPNNVLGSWMEPAQPLGGFDSCDALMRGLTVEEPIPWDLPFPLEPGFDGLSFPQSLYEDVTSDTTHMCGWCDNNGLPCNASYPPGENLKHHIAQHLYEVHNLVSSGGKSTQKCRWRGCTKELKQESIVRHILTVHLHVSATCKACGTSFARTDSLQRHVRNSCGAHKGVR